MKEREKERKKEREKKKKEKERERESDTTDRLSGKRLGKCSFSSDFTLDKRVIKNRTVN